MLWTLSDALRKAARLSYGVPDVARLNGLLMELLSRPH
jgi:hypothetical protein